MSWIAWIVLGLIAGAIAKMIMPGKDPGGWIVTILLGIIGAIVGGFLGERLLDIQFNYQNIFGLKNLGISIAGSLVLLFVYRLFKK